MERSWKWVMIGVGATAGLGLLAAAAFLYSGLYPIAANEPHSVVVDWVFTTLQKHAVATHSDDDMPVPELADAELLADGLALYHEHCAVCHGAPGVERAVMGRGLNPDPPRLATEIREWTDRELFWIVANGLKMAGMPAFQPGLDDREIWATVAFMRALPQMTPGEYRRATSASRTVVASLMAERLSAPVPHPGTPVDLAAGRRLVEAYGCGTCHVIPGVANSKGQVGPPLEKFGLRHYIAGAVLNNPENLTAWIMAPEMVEPGTAMPSVGASAEDAHNMAAYLLSLGADESIIGPKGIFPAAWLPKH